MSVAAIRWLHLDRLTEDDLATFEGQPADTPRRRQAAEPLDPRSVVRAEVSEQRLSLSALSRKIGRNDAYLQQWLERGTPKRLPELERLHLAMALNIDERLLGARDPWEPVRHDRTPA